MATAFAMRVRLLTDQAPATLADARTQEWFDGLHEPPDDEDAVEPAAYNSAVTVRAKRSPTPCPSSPPRREHHRSHRTTRRPLSHGTGRQ